MAQKLNAKQLRKPPPDLSDIKVRKNNIYIVLDNVLDTYNIGSIFRLADAIAAKKLYLCGGSATPPNHRIKKASINTTEWVEWEYAETATEVIKNLKCRIKNLQIIAIEQSDKTVPYDKFEYKLPICLVVGNETTGVSPKVLKMVDAVVELPMFGVNISLNVMMSLGIILYEIVSQLKLSPQS